MALPSAQSSRAAFLPIIFLSIFLPTAYFSISVKSEAWSPYLSTATSSNFIFSGCPPVNSASSTENSSFVLIPFLVLVGSIHSP